MAKNTVNVRMTADVGNYDANIAKARRQLEGFKKDNLTMGGVMKQMSSSLVGVASRFMGVTAAVGALGMAFRNNIQTARGFEKSMSQLSSLTGMTGRDLDTLKEYAIELGSKTTLSASQVADAFKLIGSQQPQLLSSASALKEVTQYAIRLSEAAGIELATAAQTLSTSINQMGGDSNNAARYVNVLAAASQKGAGDIAWLGEAITKAATAAKAVGTDYEELVGNLEQLAKAGFDASTAGTALRSIIMNLEKQSNQQFKPSVVGLTQAFDNLAKAQLDITGYQQIAGKMFATQAKVLAEAADAAKDMTAAITGTNIAEEQASTNTANLDGSLKSLASAWEGLNLHINDSNGLLKSAVDWLKDVVTWADQAFTAAGRAQKRLAELQGGGNGEPTKVDSQIAGIQALDGSRVAQMNEYNAIRYGYEDRIKQIQSRINDYVPNGTKAGTDYIRALDAELAATEKMRDEFMDRAAKILFPTETKAESVTIPIEADTDRATESLSELKAQLKDLRKLRDLAIDNGDFATRDDLNAEIKDIQANIKAMQGTGTTSKSKKEVEPLDGSIDAQIKKVKELQDAFNAAGSQGVRMGYAVKLKEAERELERMRTSANMLVDPSKMAISGTELSPIAAPTFENTDLEKAKALANIADQNREAWNAAANAIGSVGQALQMIEDPAIKVAGIIAEAIANIALSFSQAMSKAAGAGPWGWLAFAATGTATMISTIAAIKQATAGSYATGGIVPGNHFSGDQQLIRANAGEVVLNQAQQGVLASRLQQGSLPNNLQLSAVITGEQIRLVLNNNGRRTLAGEYLTTKMQRP